jgi:hypothetical protein
MLLTRTLPIAPDDVANYAWASLRRFLNVEFVAQRIIELHNVPEKHHDNARKQARQIRYCLMQAREYADAAKSVSIVTKPNLLYYSTMCLALAELLLKGQGTVSLDYARAQHAHHGLQFVHSQVPPSPLVPVTESAAALKALPRLKGDVGFGTFALWHKTSRHVPLTGSVTTHNADYTQTHSYDALFNISDDPPPPLPTAGVSLLDLLVRLPAMAEHMAMLQIPPRLVRATVRASVDRTTPERSTVQIALQSHPTTDDILDAFVANCKFSPGTSPGIKLIRKGGGVTIVVRTGPEEPPQSMSLPQGISWRDDELRMFVADEPLTEFGLYYVALFIASNYARYFPDRWVAEIEDNSFLALTIGELLQSAEQRLPLLCLSELARVYYVLKR